MTILVTGGSGFIGTQLVENLLARGRVVRVLDHHPALPGAQSLQGDVRDRALVARAVEGVQLIYHLAAEHRDDVQPVSLYDDVNVTATRHLLDCAGRAGTRTIVFTSSVAVYGLAAGMPAEDTAPTPFNDYGRTKLEAEALVRAWADAHPGRRAIIVRPSVVFGEDNRGNVYNLLEQIARGRFVMVGRGENRKSMAYVKNVADFLDHVVGLPAPASLYNYADKPDLSMNELLETVTTMLDRPRRKLRLPYGLGLAIGHLCDLAAAASGRRLPVSAVRVKKFCASTQIDTARAQASGFHPAYSLHQGLERTIAHEFQPGRAAGRSATASPPQAGPAPGGRGEQGQLLELSLKQ